MLEVLAGIEYRTKRVSAYGDKWNDWVSATGYKFPSNTQFRQAPVFKVAMEIDGEIETYTNKDTLMDALRKELSHDTGEVRISAMTVPNILEDRRLQVRYVTDKGYDDWRPVNSIAAIDSYKGKEFRIRPDHKYVVQHFDQGIVVGARIEFDDAVKLAEYTNRLITTNQFGFRVDKVEY
jgi:hypothetical protein